MSSKAEQILAGLGGAENIVEIEACITRLRTEVQDGSKVDEKALKAAGAHGVVAPATSSRSSSVPRRTTSPRTSRT